MTATQAAFRRFKAKGELTDPHRGFPVVVPPEYRRLGCPLADHFVPQLMQHCRVMHAVTWDSDDP